jgi:hypothetical protein
MKAQIHFRDAMAWIAKAPPLGALSFEPDALAVTETMVLRFPTERVRHGQQVGLAGGAEIIPLRPSINRTAG